MKNIKSFTLFTEKVNIENETRLSAPIINILNTQIKNELESSQIYMGMACWLDDQGWIGASKYFYKASKEELIHMYKIYDYIFDKNCLAKVPAVAEVKQSFKDIREVLELSLEHEIKVTANWENIAEMAKKESDNTTYEFTQWFLNEQKEEESKIRDILFKLNLDMPKYELDELFEELTEG